MRNLENDVYVRKNVFGIIVQVTGSLRHFITYRAKLLNPDWLRQRAFFLNHEGTFGNQEGMIT